MFRDVPLDTAAWYLSMKEQEAEAWRRLEAARNLPWWQFRKRQRAQAEYHAIRAQIARAI